MQPNSTGRQKLAQLTQRALEALLESDDLKVASENSAIAAVAFWLDQEGRAQQLNMEQKQGLAYRLRLLRATPWYLTRLLSDEDHWLYRALRPSQRVMLTAALHNPLDFGKMKPEGRGMMKKLFGQGEGPPVAWSKQPRCLSSITKGKVLLEASLRELWDKPTYCMVGPVCFYNGIEWAMTAKVAAHVPDEEPPLYQLGAFVQHSSRNQPVVFTALLEVVGVRDQDTKQWKFDAVLCQDGSGRGYGDACGGRKFTSLKDALTKLDPYIHSGGKLHFRATITDVG